MRPTTRGIRRTAAALAVLAAPALAGVLVPPSSVAAPQLASPTVVSDVPASFTPAVDDGYVDTIAQVGPTMVIGGTFTGISPSGSAVVDSRPHVAAFDATTGTISSTFTPTVDGQVNAVLPGPAAGEVYVAGTFDKIDGVRTKLALLNLSDGSIVSGWSPQAFDGPVNTLARVGSHLIAGGDFTSVGGDTHEGMVALAASTGQLSDYLDLSFTGHHDYGTKCNPAKRNCIKGEVGIRQLSVNPAGDRLVAIGDFIDVSGASRDQIAMIDLGGAHATLDTGWATDAYTAECLASAFDSDVRTVQYSPDGSYFIVTATGASNLRPWGVAADGTRSPCDAVARFDSSDRGQDVQPVWVDRTGNDALLALAVTDDVIYVGGHERWMNNSLGRDNQQEGAVPRPGIGAIDPANGLPITWNPGRNPRGFGVLSMLATSTGLWFGSDTEYVGNRTYVRKRLAFFPYSGGSTLPADTPATVPGRVFLAGAVTAHGKAHDRFAYRDLTATSTSDLQPVDSPVDWAKTRGAFTVAGEVVYGKPDGDLYERSFDGSTFGGEVHLDPYHDPAWDNVGTGSGQTYEGVSPGFTAEVPSVSAMFFSKGRLYYTVSGRSRMYYRWYEPDDGVVGEDEFTVAGSHGWGDVAGAALIGGRLYFGRRASGHLESVKWSHDAPSGAPRLVSGATDWASRGLFALPPTGSPAPAPKATITEGRCAAHATCSFTAKKWRDPSGGAAHYTWSFGDGGVASGRTATHAYTSNGRFPVTLTVSDAGGGEATAQHPVRIHARIAKVGFDGAVSATGRTRHLTVRPPRHSRSGDTLVLVVSDQGRGAAKLPKAWKRVASASDHGLHSAVFTSRAARAGRSRPIRVKLARKSSVIATVAAYRGLAVSPVRAVAHSRAHAKHRTAPTLRGVSAGEWVVWSWDQLTGKRAHWKRPSGAVTRTSVATRHAPFLSALLADSRGRADGTVHSGSARSSRAARAGLAWSLSLAPRVS